MEWVWVIVVSAAAFFIGRRSRRSSAAVDISRLGLAIASDRELSFKPFAHLKSGKIISPFIFNDLSERVRPPRFCAVSANGSKTEKNSTLIRRTRMTWQRFRAKDARDQDGGS